MNSKVSLQEAMEARRHCEAIIVEAIKDFVKATDLYPTDLELRRVNAATLDNPERVLFNVRLRVEL